MRTWVCPDCETGGKDTHPLICEWCGRPALDIGPDHIEVNGSLITRVVRARKETA